MVSEGEGSPELPVVGQIVHCRKCERKLLVERALIGTNHTVDTHVTCWDCLDKATQARAQQLYHLHVNVENASRPTD